MFPEVGPFSANPAIKMSGNLVAHGHRKGRDGTTEIPLAATDADLVHLEGSCCSTRQRTAMFPAYWKLRLDT